MSSSDFTLATPPEDSRARELWLQHAAGRILFEDVRDYARKKIDASLEANARAAAERAIDDALYGVMMILDGVSGTLSNETHEVDLAVTARLSRRTGAAPEVLTEVALRDGDGMCMAFHDWREKNFGKDAITE